MISMPWRSPGEHVPPPTTRVAWEEESSGQSIALVLKGEKPRMSIGEKS